MSRPLLVNAPFAAAAAVIIAATMLLGFKVGVDATTLVLVILSGLTGGLAWMTYALNKSYRQSDQQARQGRLAVERWRGLLQTVPAGYCLFTPQGMLREVVDVTALLGVEKVEHVENIVAALKDAQDFVTAFRVLQQQGAAFSLSVQTTDGRYLQISGKRFRIGNDGPLIDAVWIADNPFATQQRTGQADALAVAHQQRHEAQAMLDALPFPVWGRSADTNLIFCNHAYAQALDTAPESVLTQQQELASPTARAGSGRALAANALGFGEARSERRHVIIGGKRRLLDIIETPITDGEGKPVGLVGTARDVTVEEEKDAELERHIQAQNEVLEQLGSAIAVYGRDTRLLFYNRAYQRLWDASEAFLNGKPTFGEVLEDLRARRRSPEQADFQRYKKERLALFTSLMEPREDMMHLPNGTSLRILSAPHPLGGIMFVHEDVTDRLALEVSYNTLIAVQRETLDNLAEGIAVFGPDGKLRLFNPSFAATWNLAADFLNESPHIGQMMERMKPLFAYGEDWNRFKTNFIEYALDRTPRRGRIERADHAILDTITVPLPDGAVLSSFSDVTNIAKVEQALRGRNAALAAADRLKSEFVANVSYQLRTPINTIMGFAEILANQYFGTLNERQMEYARTIMDASKKLLLLINDVLDLATIQAGRMALNRKNVVVADLLNAARQTSLDWARRQSLDIQVDCPADVGTFEADEHRIKQVLAHLISNAIKYTAAGGRITLTAHRGDTQMALTVADTGIGIPEADRERIFVSFERANAQARQSGAGLGLSLVKSFVELHGGHIEIVSAVNKGTKVTCLIPLHPPAQGVDDVLENNHR